MMLIADNHLILILRSDEMPTHKGQIAFVGGHKHANEEEPIVTALRELQEETLIDEVEVLGLVHPVKTSTQSVIVPVIAKTNLKIPELFSLVKSNGEWTEMFAIALPDFHDSSRWCVGVKKTVTLAHDELYFFSILPNSYSSYNNTPQLSHCLWGASAQMVWNALSILSKEF